MNSDNVKYVITITDADSVRSPRTLSALSFAAHLAETAELPEALVVIGTGLKDMPAGLAGELATDVFFIEADNASLSPDALLKTMSGIFSEIDASYIVFPDKPEYSAIAPALAALLDSAWIPGVMGIGNTEEGIIFSRSVWGGKYLADIRPEKSLTILTVSGSFSPYVKKRNLSHSERFLDIKTQSSKSYVEGWTYGEKAEAGLKEAKVIISAGQGIGGPENIELLRQVSELVPGCSIGCSRPVCDQGWMEYKHQVGITGAIVSPRLYIACGISGSSQHIQGMQDAETVVAINTDKNAPFFRHADIGIVDDVTAFLPELIKQLKDA